MHAVALMLLLNKSAFVCGFSFVNTVQGRPVMVLCNLKARNMRGIKSDGMLLCASNDTHESVEPLMPHTDSQPGERVAYGDDETATQPEPETPNKASSVVLPGRV